MAEEGDFAFFNDTDIMTELRLFSARFYVASSIMYSLIAIVGIVANGLVVYRVMRHKPLRTKNNFFIANLAAADTVLFLALILPRGINFFTELQVFVTPESMNIVWYIQHVCIQATALILVFMTFSRFTTVVFPLRSRALWTTFRVWACCAASWIISIIIYIPILFGVLYTHKGGYNIYYTPLSIKILALIKMILIFIIPFTVIVYCYSKIIITFRKGRYEMKRSANIDAEQSDDQSRKLTRMVLIIIFVFFLSWAPIQSYATWLICRAHTLPRTPTNWRLIDIIGFCFRLTAYLGGAINPFIYAYTNPSFKKSNMFRMKNSNESAATASSQL